jgi:UDPglucose--hexose-1-phosphate uridylyltransferase
MILDELKVTEYSICEIDPSAIDELSVPDPVLDPVLAYAVENKAVKEADKAKLSKSLMNYLIKRPSEITDIFNDIHKKSPQKAFEWLYDYAIKSNYVNFTEIAKNKHWEAKGTKGRIELTINAARPENDNKQIEKAALEKSKSYPYCALCRENEGFNSALTLRTVPLTLGGEEWFWQYSPYSYFNQHGIAVKSEHTPMKIDRGTFSKLLEFTDFMPGYFIGSNAALPLVGGSVLSHEHFQGGKPVMPMFKAPVLRKLKCAAHPYVKIELLDWYNTVLRISYTNKENLADFAEIIRSAWENYSDSEVLIEAKTGAVKHNALTPVARRYPDGSYSLDLILRNNRTADDAPYGIFGIGEAHRPIKKESIALTESMGWFILPGRLAGQLSKIERFLTKETRFNPAKLDEDMIEFRPMIEKLIKEMGSQKMTAKEAELTVRDEVNRLCEEILERISVFKKTADGVNALNRFLAVIGVE